MLALGEFLKPRDASDLIKLLAFLKSMLKTYQLQEITNIAEFANNCLESWGYKELLFKSLDWDELRRCWVVGFVINGQTIFIAVQPSLNNSYQYGGIVR